MKPLIPSMYARLMGIIMLLIPHVAQSSEVHIQLRQMLQTNNILPVKPIAQNSAEKVELGRMLFFDKELSGNRDTACSSCHHPAFGMTDQLSLPIGTGSLDPNAIGIQRVKGDTREFVPRNAPDTFHRAPYLAQFTGTTWEVIEGFTSMFWDSRVQGTPSTGFTSPAGAQAPKNMDSALAMQALFPPTSNTEMRGEAGDVDVYGQPNELAMIEAGDFTSMWNALTRRIQSIEAYRTLVESAYPGTSLEELTIADIGNALGAFQADVFAGFDARWDLYVAGVEDALSYDEKQGAVLFYGKGKCGNCHSGPLFTDQQHYNIASPQFYGAQPGDSQNYDTGLMRRTQNPDHFYQFRTPTLRNVGMTSPYMHAGTYTTLAQAVVHHIDAKSSLAAYDGSTLVQQDLYDALIDSTDDTFTAPVLNNLSTQLDASVQLTETEVDQIVAFLHTLTSQRMVDMYTGVYNIVPTSVPSGLPVQ